MADQPQSFRTSQPLAHGAGSALGNIPSSGSDTLSLSEVTTVGCPVCASFRDSVPEEPSVSFAAMCLASAPASQAALDNLQEQMLSFQAAMQRQMEAITSFVVSSQPLVVPAIHQDSTPEPSVPATAPMVTPPVPPVEHEILVPTSAPLSGNLHPPQGSEPGLQVEDISPVPSLHPSLLASSRDDVSTCHGDLPRKDPFERSALEGFSLLLVGSTLSPRPSVATPSQCEEYLWLILCTGATDGSRPRKVQKDKTKKLYKQDLGLFAASTWPALLPIFNCVMEEDKALRNLQAQWGMVGLALIHAINHLEACIGPVMIASDPEHRWV